MSGKSTMVDWNDRNLAILRKGVAAGKSYAQIAKEIGPGVSRSAAIGKAHRLEIAQPRDAAAFNMRFGSRNVTWGDIGSPEEAEALELRHVQAARERHRLAEKRRRQTVADRRVAIARAATVTAPPAPLDVSGAKPWTERKLRECAWPIEINGETYSCCAKVGHDSPNLQYCSGHLKKLWKPTTPGKRQMTKAELIRSVRRYA